MRERVLDFVNNWITENINAGAYAPEGGPHPGADAAVTQLLDDASRAGFSREEIEKETGDLINFISSAFEDATDAEVQRLVDKDPF